MDTTVFKKPVLLVILLFNVFYCFSQFKTVVDVGSIENKTVKAKIDGNVSKLLSEFNMAFTNKTVPSLAAIEMSDEAKSAVLAIWETSPFRSQEDEIYENILNLNGGGMELRNIRLFMSNADSANKNQEGVFVLTKTGTIDNFYLSIGTGRYNQVMADGKDVADMRCRESILNFVENFRTSYNRKDLDFLKKVFSEDALIITGKVIKENVSDGNSLMQRLPKERIVYVKQKKSEYMTKMKNIFEANSYLNIKFEELKVVRHGKYPNYYGVTLKQYWNSSKYNDVGYVFLLIDFRDEEHMLIHVRTWQPSMVNDRELTKGEIFNIGSFKVN
jgi:RPA family protein